MPRIALPDAVLCESIRLIEEPGALDDAQALRSALAAGGDRVQQAIERARQLARRLELASRLQRARALAPWVLLALALLVVLAGLSLAGAVVDTQGRRINVLAALVALLGLHAFTLIVWLAALLLPGASVGTLFGRAWLALTARLTLGKGAEPATLLRAASGLVERARLTTWALGFASHAVWSTSFAVVLAALWFAFAFKSYTLTWETTILTPQTFAAGVRVLSPAPALLGFPVPDAASALAVAPDAASQRDWAWWLIGCVLVYGLLPRFVCALWCAAVWRARRGALAPDWSLPYYRRLFARLDALAPATVVDPDRHAARHPAAPAGAQDTADALAVIGFELPPETPWPPPGLPANVALLRRIEGSAAERNAVLDALTPLRPRLALLLCHAASSPDRGTERFVRELLPLVGELRLWLLGAPPPTEAQTLRWREWLAASGLGALPCIADSTLALEGASP